ncbi:subtilisin-like protease SBT2.4 [Tanacetum coccineum]|uniref:Subtilisin-like protease SBT2.4 n=1 Tax=Tanacetum coccineum TaxID=301880 RepID=A0ABQ5ALF1_9ASTR
MFNYSFQAPSDLNIPSLTISALNGKQLVRRTVKNVADTAETYVCAVVPPNGVAVELNPPSYGEIVLTGNMKHIVRIPLSVLPASMPEI